MSPPIAETEVVLAVTKRERLNETLRRVRDAAPFPNGFAARGALERIMNEVEDQFSGIPRNPHATTAPTDGRMYPPDDMFEIQSGSWGVRTFKQTRHRTSFGENGALEIVLWDGTVEISLCGQDGKFISDIRAENKS